MILTSHRCDVEWRVLKRDLRSSKSFYINRFSNGSPYQAPATCIRACELSNGPPHQAPATYNMSLWTGMVSMVPLTLPSFPCLNMQTLNGDREY